MKRIDLPEEEIIKLYTIDKISHIKLAKLYGVSSGVICRILRQNSIKGNPPPQKYPYDEQFFLTDSAQKYYFFGFSLGDGCLQKFENLVYYTVTLKNSDDCVLQNFCKWTNRDVASLRYYHNNENNGDFVRLNFNGKIWRRDWSELGLVSKKTHNPSKLNIPEEWVKPFLIGFIDADGHVTFKKNTGYTIQMVGHPQNMNWVIDIIRKLGFTGNINSRMVKGKWKRIRIQRKNDVIELAKILEITKYSDIFLKRKWNDLYEYLLGIDIE